MSLKTTLTNNNTKITADKAINEQAYNDSLITVTRRDEIFTKLDDIETNNNNKLVQLDNNIGHKETGSLTSLEDALNNKSKEKDSIAKSISKYDSNTDITHISTTSQALCDIDGIDIDYPDNIDITSLENWIDNSWLGYSLKLLAHSDLLNSIESGLITIKDDVYSFVTGIINLSNNISISNQVKNLDDLSKNKILCGKSVKDIAEINEFNSSDDKGEFMKNKIDLLRV